MKAFQYLLTLGAILLVISVNGCSDVETSESLKETYGTTPVGVEECDNYLNKLRLCLDKAPSKNHENILNIYTFVVSDMTNLVSDNSPESHQMATEACTLGDSANKAAMVKMGCDW